MELSHLRVFVTVARERNITRAASRLQLTPSPVSRTIRELERELGTPLFERKYHELTITRAGEEQLPPALEILRLADEMLGEPPKPLRLAATPWAPQRFARRLRAAAMELGHDVDVDEAMSSELIPRLQFGDLDAALIHLPADLPGLQVRPVANYRQFLAGYPVPEGVDKHDRGVIILPTVLHTQAMERTHQLLAEQGFTKVSEIPFSDLLTVQSRMRRTGELLSTNKAHDTPIGALIDLDALEFFELDDHGLHMQLGLAWRGSDGSKAALLTAIADKLAPPGVATITF